MVLSLPWTDANHSTVRWSPVTCFLSLGKVWIVGLTCNRSTEGKSQSCLLVKRTILLPRGGLAWSKLSEPNWHPIGQWAQFSTAYKKTWSVCQGCDATYAAWAGGCRSRSHRDVIYRHWADVCSFHIDSMTLCISANVVGCQSGVHEPAEGYTTRRAFVMWALSISLAC